MVPSLLYIHVKHWFSELLIKFISCMLAGSQLSGVRLSVCLHVISNFCAWPSFYMTLQLYCIHIGGTAI